MSLTPLMTGIGALCRAFADETRDCIYSVASRQSRGYSERSR